MARIRTVKPEFFRHEELQDLEMDHPDLRPMLVFEGLWSQCDKNGVFEWKPRTLELDIIPFIWRKTGKQLDDSLMILREGGFVKQMEYEGKLYGFVPSFKDHQRITGKEATEPPKFPEPAEMIEVSTGETLGKQSGNTGDNRKGKGRERKGNGRERNKDAGTSLFSLPSWVPEKEWNAFVAMRVQKKKPMTDEAKDLAISTLEKLKEEGHPPGEVLNQSVFNSWQGLFPPKPLRETMTMNEKGKDNGKRTGIVEPARHTGASVIPDW